MTLIVAVFVGVAQDVVVQVVVIIGQCRCFLLSMFFVVFVFVVFVFVVVDIVAQAGGACMTL